MMGDTAVVQQQQQPPQPRAASATPPSTHRAVHERHQQRASDGSVQLTAASTLDPLPLFKDLSFSPFASELEPFSPVAPPITLTPDPVGFGSWSLRAPLTATTGSTSFTPSESVNVSLLDTTRRPVFGSFGSTFPSSVENMDASHTTTTHKENGLFSTAPWIKANHPSEEWVNEPVHEVDLDQRAFVQKLFDDDNEIGFPSSANIAHTDANASSNANVNVMNAVAPVQWISPSLGDSLIPSQWSNSQPKRYPLAVHQRPVRRASDSFRDTDDDVFDPFSDAQDLNLPSLNLVNRKTTEEEMVNNGSNLIGNNNSIGNSMNINPSIGSSFDENHIKLPQQQRGRVLRKSLKEEKENTLSTTAPLLDSSEFPPVAVAATATTPVISHRPHASISYSQIAKAKLPSASNSTVRATSSTPTSTSVASPLNHAAVVGAPSTITVSPFRDEASYARWLEMQEAPLCPFAKTGTCRYGEHCRYLHGLACPHCGRECLHPFNVSLQQEHLRECVESFVPSAEESAEVHCGLCGERVLSKKDARFGLLNCDHAFCLACIRQWRSQPNNISTSASDTSARSCPLCRTLTHFITPSTVWLTNGDEKTRLIEEYKRKLRAIPCKYYNYGESSCPFGASCFYAHSSRDGSGRLVNQSTSEADRLRTYVNGDAEVRVLSAVKLSDFLDEQIRQSRHGPP